MKRRYGFFSLIGLLGFWTHNPMYFLFLGFALFFEYFFVHNSDVALTKGIGLGFGVAIIVFCFVTACFDWKDRRGVSND